MKARLALEARSSEGESCPTPVVWLRVRDRYGAFAELKFRVDTQADVTGLPISLAEKEHIPYTRTREGMARGITGRIKKYRNRLQVVIAGREHDWPCDFTEPAIDPQTNQPLKDLSPVLGRAGFLDDYAVTVDSAYLIITRLGPLRRWVRGRLHELWKLFGMVHAEKRPL
jgi:hypothetical protein